MNLVLLLSRWHAMKVVFPFFFLAWTVACSGSVEMDHCGDGIIQQGETCDPASSCPQNCDDGDSCTADEMTGASATCNVACHHVKIEECQDGDGCCLANCDHASDNDCSASCGNGIIELNETCDPPATCPTSCDDQNPCTQDHMSGSASACDVVCVHDANIQCQDGDGCCPEGCTANLDADCLPVCGNNAAEADEFCDGSDLRGKDCLSLDHGYVGGSLQCDANCAFEESGCTSFYVFDLLYRVTVNTALGEVDREDIAIALRILQGLANRDRPRLYLYTFPINYAGYNQEDVPGPADGTVEGYWLTKMQEQGRWLHGKRFEVLNDWTEVLMTLSDRFACKIYNDPNVPATRNAAVTESAIENCLLVKPGGIVDSFLPNVPLKRDYRGKFPFRLENGNPVPDYSAIPDTGLATSGSVKNDVYRWMAVQFLYTGRANGSLTGQYYDGWKVVSPFGDGYDLPVASKAFLWDLDPFVDEQPCDDSAQPLGTDAATLQIIFDLLNQLNLSQEPIKVLGFPPFPTKYSNYNPSFCPNNNHIPTTLEHQFFMTISSRGGIGFVGSDIYEGNGSFHRHAPRPEKYVQNRPPTPGELVAKGYLTPEGGVVSGKTYITFALGDNDAHDQTAANMISMWNSPARGAIPLGWAINPQLQEFVPDIVQYLYETKTPNDYFLANEGAGYVFYNYFPADKRAGLTGYSKHWFRQADMSMTYLAFVNRVHDDADDDAVLDSLASFSGDGINYHFGSIEDQVIQVFLHHCFYNPALYSMPVITLLDGGVGGTNYLQPDASQCPSPKTPAQCAAERFKWWMDYHRQHWWPQANFFMLRTVWPSPAYLVDVYQQMQTIYPDEQFELVDPYTFAYLARIQLGGNNDHRYTYYTNPFPATVRQNQSLDLDFKLRNNGWDTWVGEQDTLHPYRFAVSIEGQSDRIASGTLDNPVAPGQDVVLHMSIPGTVFGQVGKVALKADMVHELVTWFEWQGNVPIRREITVVP